MIRKDYLVTKAQLIARCAFCDRTKFLEDRILLETDNFYVLAGLGPICEGYVIIATKEHVQCYGEMNPVNEAEFLRLKQKTTTALISAYGDYQLYEHGKNGVCFTDGPGTKHCYHAHLNCVPTSVNLQPMLSARFQSIPVGSMQDIRASCAYSDGYLYYENREDALIFPVSERLPGQFLRRLFCEALGEPDRVDYLANPNYPLIWATKQRLGDALGEGCERGASVGAAPGRDH